MKYEKITEKIIKAFYNVYNSLGYGFLEKVYENALLIELRKLGLKCKRQVPIKVFYENQIIGEYIADILVENKIIIELKAIKQLTKQDEAQLLNYLSSTEIEVGLLFNFGEKPEFKRKIFDNERKTYIHSNMRKSVS
ncbi:MAG: GxxExxY protein [Candidatus Cloacimonetes bacterium]|nr:GxxExxY protein [Candidatus Cloacimonadota bacterium]